MFDKLLKNRVFFAPDGGSGGDGSSDGDGSGDGDGDQKKTDKTIELTQSELDEMISKRLARDRKKWENHLAKYGLDDEDKLQRIQEAEEKGLLDPEGLQEWEKFKKEKEELEMKKKQERGEFQETLKKKEQEFQKKESEYQQKLTKYKREIQNAYKDRAATDAVMQYGIHKDFSDFVVDRIKNLTFVGEDRQVYVKGENEGEPRLNEKGQEMTVAELVEEMIEQRPSLVPTSSGSGTSPGAFNKTKGGRWTLDKLKQLSTDEVAQLKKDGKWKDIIAQVASTGG